MGFRIFFVSGETSTPPITSSTPGYIASTSTDIAAGESGSVTWTGLSPGTWKWHAYVTDGSEWSPKSDVWSFTIKDIPKFILFSRYGANDAGNPVTYRICSGSGKTAKINLVSGGPGSISPTYPVSWTDRNGKIWVMVQFDNPSVTSHARGDHSCLWTVAPSLNSWKGGWDYWFYPNGTLAGSGSLSTGVVKKAGTAITWTSMSSNKAGPVYRCDNSAPAGYRQEIYDAMTMPNGELCMFFCAVGHNTDIQRTKEFYYLSSNGTWYHPLTIPSTSVAPANCGAAHGAGGGICVTSSNILLLWTSGGVLWGKVSTDCGRNWGNDIEITDAGGTDHTWVDPKGVVPKGDAINDDIARVFVVDFKPNECTGHMNPSGGKFFIYRISTNSPTLAHSRTHVNASGTSIGHWPTPMISQGEYNNGWIVFAFPWHSANTDIPNVNPSTNVQGDPRYLFFWNENTDASGQIHFDKTGGFLKGSHSACCVRFDDNGILWAAGAAYYGANEGDNASRGQVINPDICSGTTSPTDSWSEVYDDVETQGGGCGATFEIFY